MTSKLQVFNFNTRKTQRIVTTKSKNAETVVENTHIKTTDQPMEVHVNLLSEIKITSWRYARRAQAHENVEA